MSLMQRYTTQSDKMTVQRHGRTDTIRTLHKLEIAPPDCGGGRPYCIRIWHGQITARPK